ncbi:MAG: hypothetical protein U0869_01660 [Chloroflexota bacterium]
MTTALPSTIEPVTAAPMLQHWGFLAHSDLPDREGPSYLLVSIRPKPTLEHYDPEEMTYWVTDNGRGAPAVLSRTSKLPVDAQTTWGMVRVTDRLRVTNEWLSFGGQLRVETIDDAMVAVLTSSAPLLRRGGHSQGWDVGAPSVGAFFAKVRAAAGFDHRFEAAEAAADPLARYACFVAEQVRRYRHSEVLQGLDPDLWHLMQHEEHRMKTVHPDAWDSGVALLRALDAASTSQLMGDHPHPL